MAKVDKARRKELLRQYRRQEREAAQAQMPLTPAQLDALHDYLETYGESIGCDHTTRIAEQWIIQNELHAEAILEALREFGGCCDCEVLANVTRDRFGWPDRPNGE